ncbi:MAG: hypothetical protein M1433_01705 [Candidatus Parvarchaeota archaeon]|nr:hypothetical protein [Candidatus Parvarchaeota archaeon]
MGFAGTSITNEDAEIILTSLVKAYSIVPAPLKQLVPKLETILEAVPDEARKYSLDEIIKLLSWASQNEIII